MPHKPMTSAPLDQEPGEIRRFTSSQWEVRIVRTGTGDSGRVLGHADLRREGVCRCRLVLCADSTDEWAIANALQSKAIDWIDDWERRDHGVATGFHDL